MTRNLRITKSTSGKKRIEMKHLIIVALLVGAAVLFWPHQAATPTKASTSEAGCNVGDPAHAITRLVGDPQACISELKGTVPGVSGTGQTAYVRYDGTSWTGTGPALSNPSVKQDGAKVYSSGAVALQISLHNAEGLVVYTTGAVRGNAALMQLDWTEPDVTGVTIEDSERGTYEVALA